MAFAFVLIFFWKHCRINIIPPIAAFYLIYKMELEVRFKINDEIIALFVPPDDSGHLFKITNDDVYSIDYLIQLTNNGFISLKEPPITSISRIDDDGTEIPIYPNPIDNENQINEVVEDPLTETFNDTSETPKQNYSEWTDNETKMLLDLYEQFLPNIGPFKQFKTKKSMWSRMAEMLNDHFKTNKTGVQVENRYKTVLKRKKAAVDNNNQSGFSRIEIPYEAELHKIASIDDSILPEVTGTASGVKIIKRSQTEAVPTTASRSSEAPPKKRPKTIQETLLEIHEKKEESRERRHREKLELIKGLFPNKTNE